MVLYKPYLYFIFKLQSIHKNLIDKRTKIERSDDVYQKKVTQTHVYGICVLYMYKTELE